MARRRRTQEQERFFILRIRRAKKKEVYIFSPGALGEPISDDAGINAQIDKYISRGHAEGNDEKVTVDFALFVESDEAGKRMCEINHPHPPHPRPRPRPRRRPTRK